MFDEETLAMAEALLSACRARGLKLVTAESCSGGLIAAALTAIPGSSEVVVGGFVTYSNDAKIRWLGVPQDILDRHGAVSFETARAMAICASQAANSALSLAVTGIAGPGGGSAEKPVGLVFVATHKSITSPDLPQLDLGFGTTNRYEFTGCSREEIRRLTVLKALQAGLTYTDALAP